ncbi:MAG: hypothetical protein O2887_16025 [Bacteroidetes bacterium]|nr:hypothetical protein [Bacteroidota bacterium]
MAVIPLKKKVTTTIKTILSTILKFGLLIIIGVYIFNADISSNNFETSISNLLTVSSIITGIVFAYLISKLFHLKAEREKRKEEIINLSNKLTEFRRLAQHIITTHDFWKDSNDLDKFRALYPLYNYNDIHDQGSKDEKVTDFWIKDQGFSTTRADLFLAFDQVFDTQERHADWVYDRVTRFEYSLDEISSYYDASNQIWYYLDYKWEKYSVGVFNDNALQNSYYSSKMTEIINKIDENYRGQTLDRKLIAKIGSDFHGKYLVELYRLTEQNQADLPDSSKTILTTQIILLIFGVLAPLIFSTIELNTADKILGLKVFLTVVTTGLLFYVFQLFDFSRQEIRT